MEGFQVQLVKAQTIFVKKQQITRFATLFVASTAELSQRFYWVWWWRSQYFSRREVIYDQVIKVDEAWTGAAKIQRDWSHPSRREPITHCDWPGPFLVSLPIGGFWMASSSDSYDIDVKQTATIWDEKISGLRSFIPREFNPKGDEKELKMARKQNRSAGRTLNDQYDSGAHSSTAISITKSMKIAIEIVALGGVLIIATGANQTRSNPMVEPLVTRSVSRWERPSTTWSIKRREEYGSPCFIASDSYHDCTIMIAVHVTAGKKHTKKVGRNGETTLLHQFLQNAD